jgi:hypothetical protein
MTSDDKFRDIYNAAKDVKMFVTDNGEYGDASGLLFFRHGNLSFKEWKFLINNLDGHAIYAYVAAITDGETEIQKRIEEEYETN